MDEQKGTVSRAEAVKAVTDMSRRVALLHMCYARTLVDELGPEQGTQLIKKAIRAYGTKVGERMRERARSLGLEPNVENFGKVADLPSLAFDDSFSIVDGEPHSWAHSCTLAELWQEYGEDELGSLYCLVDPAKMEAYNPSWTQVHSKKIIDGDEYCERVARPVSRESKT